MNAEEYFFALITALFVVAGGYVLWTAEPPPPGCHLKYTGTVLVPMPFATGGMIMTQYPQYVTRCPQ